MQRLQIWHDGFGIMPLDEQAQACERRFGDRQLATDQVSAQLVLEQSLGAIRQRNIEARGLNFDALESGSGGEPVRYSRLWGGRRDRPGNRRRRCDYRTG